MNVSTNTCDSGRVILIVHSLERRKEEETERENESEVPSACSKEDKHFIMNSIGFN